MDERPVLERQRRRQRSIRSQTPTYRTLPEMEDNYRGLVRRSFTPVRDLSRSASAVYFRDYNFGAVPYRSSYNTGSLPSSRRSSVSYAANRYSPFYHESLQIEDQPLRKYDVFSIRSWSYPIWRYLHKQERRPYVLTSYTPPLMYGEYGLLSTSRRAYSGHSYVAGEHSFHLAADVSRSTKLRNYWRTSISARPWYREYYGQTSLRHFGGYRPRNIHYLTSRPLWLSI